MVKLSQTAVLEALAEDLSPGTLLPARQKAVKKTKFRSRESRKLPYLARQPRVSAVLQESDHA